MTHPIPFQPFAPKVVETLYPDQDTETSGWSPTPLHDEIDETTPFDSTFITTNVGGNGAFITVCGSPTDPQNFTVGLPDFSSAPGGAESCSYTVRARKDELLGSGHTIEMDMQLLQGASTVVASRTGITLTTGSVEYVDFLSVGEYANLLTDTSDMRLRVIVTGCVSGPGDEADGGVSMSRLQTT